VGRYGGGDGLSGYISEDLSRNLISSFQSTQQILSLCRR
jgi:hypothetical protein